MTTIAGVTAARIALLACAFVGLLLPSVLVADDYPSRPVVIVVPYPPGGTTDLLGRYEADVLQRELHQSVIVENRPGAAGLVGIGYVAKSAPDGYTLLHTPSALALLPHLMQSVSYDLAADFDPIVLVGLTEFSLVVAPSLNVNSVAELIALAKAEPGVLTYASAGIGTPHQLFAELFKMIAKVDIRHIPYKGTAPGLLDVMSGNVSMEFADLAPTLPLIKAGKLKVLAVTSPTHSTDVPDVPTLAETLPGYRAFGWQGLLAPAGTPKSTVETINRTLVADLERPETAARFKAIGIEARWSTPDEFRAFIASESAKWEQVIRAAGIEPQ